MTDWIKCSVQLPPKPGTYWVAYGDTVLHKRFTSLEWWGGDAWVQKVNGFYEEPKWWFNIVVPEVPEGD